jgi:hypothetical protein
MLSATTTATGPTYHALYHHRVIIVVDDYIPNFVRRRGICFLSWPRRVSGRDLYGLPQKRGVIQRLERGSLEGEYDDGILVK